MSTMNSRAFFGELRSYLATTRDRQTDLNLVIFRNWLRELQRSNMLPDLSEYLSTAVPYLWDVWKDKTPLGEERLLTGGEEAQLIPYVLPFMKQLKLNLFAQEALSQAPLQSVLLKHPMLRSLPKLELVHFEIPTALPGSLPAGFLHEWLVQSSSAKRLAEATVKDTFFPDIQILEHFSFVKLTHYARNFRTPNLDLKQLKQLKLIKTHSEPYAQGGFNALIANYLVDAPQLESLSIATPAQESISQDWGSVAAYLAETISIGKCRSLKHFSLALGDDAPLFIYQENGAPKTVSQILEDCAKRLGRPSSMYANRIYTTGYNR